MLYIIQNASGEKYQRQLDITREHHQKYSDIYKYKYFTRKFSSPDPGLSGHWGKIPAWLDMLRIMPLGATLLSLDCDAVIVQQVPLDQVLDPAYDLAAVKVTAPEGWWYNTGVLAIKNSGARIRNFLNSLITLGTVPGATPGEQARLNLSLEAAGMKMRTLGHEYNSYAQTPCEYPVIRAFHGEQDQAKTEALLRACVSGKAA